MYRTDYSQLWMVGDGFRRTVRVESAEAKKAGLAVRIDKDNSIREPNLEILTPQQPGQNHVRRLARPVFPIGNLRFIGGIICPEIGEVFVIWINGPNGGVSNLFVTQPTKMGPRKTGEVGNLSADEGRKGYVPDHLADLAP
ncbi:hypothetical protein [Afipia felis]